jgi:hypothetical protein
MLPYRSHWHFAFERDPFWEARLLRFAAEDIPLPENLPADSQYAGPDYEAIQEMQRTGAKMKVANASTVTIEEISKDTRGRYANAITGGLSEGQKDEIDRKQREGIYMTDEEIENNKNTDPWEDLDDERFPIELTESEKKEKKEEEKKEEEAEKMRQEDEIKQKEAMKKRFQELIESGKERAKTLNELKARLKNEEVWNQIKSKADQKIQDRWQTDLRAVDNELTEIGKTEKFATALQSLWEGELYPQRFMDEQELYLRTLPFGFSEFGTALHTMLHTAAGPLADIDEQQWTTMNQSDRFVIADQLLQNVQVSPWLASVTAQYRAMEKALKKEDRWVKSIEDQANAIIITENDPQDDGLMKILGRLRFYSINNYINGAKKYWAALMKTLEDRAERYDADVARAFGEAMEQFNFWPVYGVEVDQILSQQLDAKANEEAEAMKKSLEGDNVKWEGLFSEGGEFWKYVGKNANKTRGILDYAAEKGFLYDIDDDLHNHDHPIYGKSLKEICFDWEASGDHQKTLDYFTALRGKNSSGREHEIDHGYKMEHDVENVPRFIEMLEHELDEHNLWAAAGVCKRAMERGLQGEVAAWLFTTVMQKLREHPDLRKFAPVAFFDIIGKLSMYQTAFTLGWAKGYRNQLRIWAKTKDIDEADEALAKQTVLGNLNVIQKEILEYDKTIDISKQEGRSKLNNLVAKVLASQVVELPGHHYIHIFQTRFKDYREKAKGMFASTADPLKEDSDYAVEDTEKTMLPQVVFKDILAYTSTFEFKNESWVQAFIGSLIRMAETLRDIPELADAYKNYCDEIREKLNLHFGSFMNEDRAIKQLYTMESYGNRPALATLITSKLLDLDKIKSKTTHAAIIKQIRDVDFGFYSTIGGTAGAPPRPGSTSPAPTLAP